MGLRTLAPALALGGMLVAAPRTVVAQSAADSDSPWLPWLGCWQLVADVVKLPAVLQGPGEKEYRVPDEQLVCVTPGPEGEAKLSTYADGELLLEETLFADGVRRPFAVSECRGHQVTEWSTNQALLFFRSEMSCEDGSQRSFTGVSFFRRWNTWVDIQALVNGTEREVVIRRYRPASSEAVSKLGFEDLPPETATAVTVARAAISRPLTMGDLAEASDKIDSAAVEAALMESGSTFDLNSKTLVQLANAGISPDTIDLMVALAYPEHFEVSRETQGRSYGGGNAALGHSYNYWNTFYFAPFGYYYWYTPYRTFYVRRPVVIPGEGISGGRLVKGRGYTRVGRTSGGAVSGGSVHRRGSSSTSKGSSSGSGSASSKGYSKGGSSSSRTAKPRKP
ncbi:MAG: hypothetical protein V3V11_06990 [Vicinamibacteria bacterium]